MSRKTDLEQHIRESYNLTRDFEDILRLSDNPKEKARARRAIEEQQEFVKGYLEEYTSLCERVSLTMPEDIVEIAITAGISLPSSPPVQPQTGPTPTSSPAGATRSLPNAYALLIGVGAYQHLSPLSKTTTDASDLYSLMTQSGYPAANSALLLNDQASKTAISDKLDWLARRAGSDSTVLIFFSGHGAQRIGGFEPGEYLCPAEADWHNLRATAISDQELTVALRAIPARRVVVLLDACHSGGVGEPKDPNLAVKPGLSEAAYEELATGEGRVVIASCKPDEISWEFSGMRNGLFTHYLLEALRGAAAIRGDGYVRIYDLAHYVQEKVPQRHPDQHPIFKGADIDMNFPVALAGKSEP